MEEARGCTTLLSVLFRWCSSAIDWYRFLDVLDLRSYTELNADVALERETDVDEIFGYFAAWHWMYFTRNVVTWQYQWKV